MDSILMFISEDHEMTIRQLNDDEWLFLEPLLPGKLKDRGVTAKDNRLFVDAVLWVGITGARWREMPVEFGDWHAAYVRYLRWQHDGVWNRLLDAAGAARALRLKALLQAALHGCAERRTGPKPGRTRGTREIADESGCVLQVRQPACFVALAPPDAGHYAVLQAA
jgi:transposase